jgi:hypothetical protein
MAQLKKTLLSWEFIDKILIFSGNKDVMLKMKRYYALSKTEHIDDITDWVYGNGHLDFIKYLINIKIIPTKT